MEVEYKGTRWYKCDLHLHTTASLCFQDKTVTPEQWVDRAIEQGLHCVAVTDHNTGASIDEIKDAADKKGLTVFPGVEITCDSSKVHLLIIFDVTKTTADIRDFLVRSDIRADDFGKQEAATTKSIFEIANLASADGAIVIPAHIDEYNGLGDISVANLKKFYSEFEINAVQVVHKEFLDEKVQIFENRTLKTFLNEFYSKPSPSIDDTTIKKWFTPVKYALENNLAILTFSDNPHEEKNSQHGLWGIGSHYTWIKMDEIPSLEGLRQAFLLPAYRVKNEFDCSEAPYKKPKLWFKSISISNTVVTGREKPLKVEFSPQLNTLIGGRGSGKSSLLRFIRGVFNRTADLTALDEILKDHDEFYKKESGRPKKGVLTEESKIEIEYARNNVLHKIIASRINDSISQNIEIERLNEEGNWESITDVGYIEFFEFDHYSQKQIYEIAREPNALRERIDTAIEGLDKLKVDRERIKKLFLEKSAAIRTVNLILSEKGKIETRIKDIDESIKKLQQSGIADLLKLKESYSSQKIQVNDFQVEIENREKSLDDLAQNIEIKDIDFSSFKVDHKQILESFTKKAIDGILKIKDELLRLKGEASQLKGIFVSSVNSSQWQSDLNENMLDFELKRQQLAAEGIDVITNFERLSEDKIELERKLEEIESNLTKSEADKKERDELQDEYLRLSKMITRKRREFVQSIVTGDKVKVSIKAFRNRADFETRLRKLIQRENNQFQVDIDALVDRCFAGNVEQTIKDFRGVFLKIKANEDASSIVSGHFVNLVKSLNDAQIDEIELILPEDEIEVQYKPTSSAAFKSLSTASAGQKTTAILTFILSYGKVPLILDQPEDDLDNRLVYELIVDRLKHVKENRQLIVVTHNANIPVNGDSEYIISMDSESKTLNVLHTGSVEQATIKKEICEVMEGGKVAFEMRSKRYKQFK